MAYSNHNTVCVCVCVCVMPQKNGVYVCVVGVSQNSICL